jgi:hypothetical protein
MGTTLPQRRDFLESQSTKLRISKINATIAQTQSNRISIAFTMTKQRDETMMKPWADAITQRNKAETTAIEEGTTQ